MHSPIIFIASKDYYDKADPEEQRKILGQDHLNADDMFEHLSASVIGADYLDLGNYRQWKPEEVFEGDTSVEIIDKSKESGIATLKVNKKAYFEDYVRVLGEYHKIIEKRLKNDEITYMYGKEDSKTDVRTVYKFKDMTKPYGGVQFMLDGEAMYNLNELMSEYMPDEFYINMAYVADYHY